MFLCLSFIRCYTLLYSEMPTYYIYYTLYIYTIYNASTKKFQRHKQCKAVEGYPNLYSTDGLSFTCDYY